MTRLFALLLVACVGGAQAAACEDFGVPGKLLYADDFSGQLGQWHAEIEKPAASSVSVAGGKLLIDAAGGATVWFKQKLEGDVLISFTRKVMVEGGKNDRLSDLNMFWMARDVNNPELFTRQGEFSEYDGLLLYYAGIGGNTNTTTRFRRYDGKGARVMFADLSSKAYLLEANKEYAVQIAVYRGCTRVVVDGKEYFQYQDPAPLRTGFFGFRTTQSRQQIENFTVHQLR